MIHLPEKTEITVEVLHFLVKDAWQRVGRYKRLCCCKDLYDQYIKEYREMITVYNKVVNISDMFNCLNQERVS